MFELDKLYKHQYNTDVAFQPITITPVNDKLIMDGFWINIVGSNRFVMISDKISVRVEDIDNWREIENG